MRGTRKRASRLGKEEEIGGLGGKWIKKGGLEFECCDSFEEICFSLDFEEEGRMEIHILGDIWEGGEGEGGRGSRRARGGEEGGVLREVIWVRDPEKEKRRVLREWVAERIKTYCPEVFLFIVFVVLINFLFIFLFCFLGSKFERFSNWSCLWCSCCLC